MLTKTKKPSRARLLNERIQLEAADFCMTSWSHCIAGTAMDLFQVPLRNTMTWDALAMRLSEILRIDEAVARALTLPPVPNELLKYVPAAFAVQQVRAAINGASADEINDGWKTICGVA